MAVYRYLPIPSDRMGFLWAVTGIDGIAVLEFGPMGTTNFATRHMEEAPIYSTHITDSVLTFGDSRPLEKALAELEKRISPKIIYVMQSAVTSIIGFDMESFCSEQQSEHRAKLIPVSLSGLSGDYTDGLAKGMVSLVREFLKPAKQKKNVFHILGASIDYARIRPDVDEIVRLMKGAFGWTPGLILPCLADLETLSSCAEGSLSLVLRKEALPAAKLLKEEAAIPYLEGQPYGIQGTIRWLEEIGQACGQSPDPHFIQQETRRLSALAVPELAGACIVSESSMAAALSRFLKEELNISNVKALAFEKKKHSEWTEPIEQYEETAADTWIREQHPELLLGNSVVTERNFGYHPCRLAIQKPFGIPNQDPPLKHGYLGFQGYQNLIEDIKSQNRRR
ncbi:nitrogenase component 1 [Anaerolentibacter hominis]|uniref:nitrogenase component 1 n=1 Tax=Anaerolentibacter hominis TaxID=3079009 RepID=UPI0031B89583